MNLDLIRDTLFGAMFVKLAFDILATIMMRNEVATAVGMVLISFLCILCAVISMGTFCVRYKDLPGELE